MFWLIRRNHMSCIINLKEGQTVRRPSQSSTTIPIMLFGSLKLSTVIPIKIESPSLVSKVVANKVHIASVDERGDTSIEKIGNVGCKVLHPVGVETHVDHHVACLPRWVVRIDMKSLLGSIRVHKRFHVRKVVAERIVPTGLTNIIRIETCGSVRSSQSSITVKERSLASKAAQHSISTVALGNSLRAHGLGALHCIVGAFVDHLDSVGVFEGHLGVVFVLFFGIGETVTYCQSSEV
mmetsp:Transcript_15839/g.34218  ORF Transcript_15839/g.34218 Transcript_15839/m.34218 type:complete len:237 (+) Transcript_15839:141-851(+)